ncbi:RrF2 family transcriptional regulator [Desulfovermiculus halophilus]|uniref:RrF2 family transcriptional regulator n=1 Tax=Desulfovermiculus halophilus TaxID=339722 RepID=UPI00054E1250|nr:Rrf2 family transcriptional regulator [Desulfovermiculus halophilus]
MKVSTRSRYGIRLLMDIAMHGQGQAVSLHEIAHRQDISLKYLEKITRILKQGGYLSGKRGPNGGHRLTKPLDQIYLGDVVRVLEEDLDLVNCWMNDTPCPRLEHCKTHQIWTELTEIIYTKLNTLSLKDLVENDVCTLSKQEEL